MRICFIGDSFVNGTGDPECLGWAGRICTAARKQGYDLTYYNLGIRRETSADILARWQGEVFRRLPSEYEGRIVLSFGVNDTTIENDKIRVELADSIANTRQILTTAKQLFPILMVSPLPIADCEQNSRSAKLSARLAEVCHQLDVPYLDAFPAMLASIVWMNEVAANDGAHPSAAGYSELAGLVQSWPGWLSWFD
ncbi:MAG: lipase [Cyanosarcina radialis HA8281-LM2]|jgi:lysophospholipase L1-like esterase|nr:lipase [Cyanosarcina radialis HA8281-LM2]